MVPSEFWVNVYRPDERKAFGFGQSSREQAARNQDYKFKRFAVVHVRLKPPGAPARYSSEHDRRNWEQYPDEMRKCPF